MWETVRPVCKSNPPPRVLFVLSLSFAVLTVLLTLKKPKDSVVYMVLSVGVNYYAFIM